MNSSDIDFSQAIDAEAQLQQELRSMFAIDTQNYLQRYSQIATNLQTSSWRSDIQELYRCIHTIKGGAVTVGAEAVLQIATALEDVLSDLRYLEPIPQLTDQHLNHLLLECGELLTVALEPKSVEDIRLILNRIQTLYQEVRQHYLPQWNELKQLQQEFAEQGFDLIVLELEIALERLPHQGHVPVATRHIAQTILGQLHQIGRELQLSSTWSGLLERAQDLLAHPANAIWRSQWLRLFQALKICIKQGDDAGLFEFEEFDRLELDAAQTEEALEATGDCLDSLTATEGILDAEMADWLDALPPLEEMLLPTEPARLDSPWMEVLPEPEPQVADFSLDQLASVKLDDELAQIDLDLLLNAPDQSVECSQPMQEPLAAIETTTLQQPSSAIEPDAVKPERLGEAPEKVQIPVTLEKLDQSAQSLIETLLALRTAQGLYQTLQSQITQLVTLAQEGAQYITHLRQLQDDYALLDRLSEHTPVNQGPVLERYRQGYTVINRLLETSLRLSELGAETGVTSQQVGESFQQIDRNAAKLQTTIEDSRLVPFQNLSFRAKAILRELTTRYGKPAQLVVQGEQMELDVGIARVLEPALLHLIRNAYDHGLESPSDRLAQGKPRQGTITLTLQRQGNLFQLQIRDDGRGIDAKVVQARAEALGLPLTRTQTSAGLLAVICQPGFSSQTQVSEISGRGIGMDVVVAQVARLNGRLDVQTVPGAGTTFQLTLPVPRLLVPCLLLQAGDHIFAIPNDGIKTITLFSRLPQRSPADESGWYVDNEAEPLLILDTLKYWQPQVLDRAIGDTAVCLYVTSTDTREGVWLLADELLEQSELIISSLPSPLITPDDLVGVSLQASGRLIPVLEANAIVKRLATAPVSLSESMDPGDVTAVPLEADVVAQSILIVDDAALMRRRLEASLMAYGYLTYTCVDGQEAWNWLQAHPCPSLIITDIEMPNMDGFTLIDRCRSHGIKVPILVVSSRLSEEWSNETRRLGATDYLTKGFSTIDLIKKINSLLNETAHIKVSHTVDR